MPIEVKQEAKQNLTVALREREREVLELMAAGLSNQAIAQKMVIEKSTVKWHIKNIYRKLQLKNRAEAIAWTSKLMAANL